MKIVYPHTFNLKLLLTFPILLCIVNHTLSGQGLSIDNYNGRTKVIPVGTTITVEGYHLQDQSRSLLEGTLKNVESNGFTLSIRSITHYDMIGDSCQQSTSRTYCQPSLMPDHYINNRAVEVITVVKKERDALLMPGFLLMSASILSGLIIAPIWGITDKSQSQFLKSSPGQVLIGSAIGFSAGLTLVILGSKKKKRYKFSNASNREYWYFKGN